MNHQSSRSSYEDLLTRLDGVIWLLLCMRNQEIMLYLYIMAWYKNYSRCIGMYVFSFIYILINNDCRSPNQLEILKKVVLPSSLGHGAFDGHKGSLYEWISSQDEHSSLPDLIRECSEALKQVRNMRNLSILLPLMV